MSVASDVAEMSWLVPSKALSSSRLHDLAMRLALVLVRAPQAEQVDLAVLVHDLDQHLEVLAQRRRERRVVHPLVEAAVGARGRVGDAGRAVLFVTIARPGVVAAATARIEEAVGAGSGRARAVALGALGRLLDVGQQHRLRVHARGVGQPAHARLVQHRARVVELDRGLSSARR